MVYDESKCMPVTPLEVLGRACGGMEIDERTYRDARHAFEASLLQPWRQPGRGDDAHPNRRYAPITPARVELLRTAGVELATRADEQKAAPTRVLEQLSGATLEKKYTSSSGGGVPWVVDEYHGWYAPDHLVSRPLHACLVPRGMPPSLHASLYDTYRRYIPHERARYSCEKCSGDVVPEKDLLGCWPLWSQFAPDEIVYRCNRTWTADPGLHEPQRYKRKAGAQGSPMPCWRTCWTPVGSATSRLAPVAGTKPLPQGADFRAHCTAACKADTRPAWQWREAWEAQLNEFVGSTKEGREWRASMEFVAPHVKDDFIWNVY